MTEVPRRCSMSPHRRGNLFWISHYSDYVHVPHRCLCFNVTRAPPSPVVPGFGIAVSLRYIYVCETYADRVQIFRQDGSFCSMVKAAFNRPIQVGVIFDCLEDEDQLIVMEENCDVLRRLNPDGTCCREIELNLLEIPKMFALSADELFVQDSSRSTCLHVFTLEGTFLRRFALSGSSLLACIVRDYIWVKQQGVAGVVVAMRPDGTIAHVCDDPDIADTVYCVAVGAEESVLLTFLRDFVSTPVSLACLVKVRPPAGLQPRYTITEKKNE